MSTPDLDLPVTLDVLLAEVSVDLETGVVGTTMGPELRTQRPFRDRWDGVARLGHPLSHGEITTSRHASGRHVLVSRRGRDTGQWTMPSRHPDWPGKSSPSSASSRPRWPWRTLPT